MLVFASSSVIAEWTLVAENHDSGVALYIDLATIRKIGNKTKMWFLRDFAAVQTADGDKYLSFKAFHEYDCEEERFRLLAFTMFREKMGQGKTVYYHNGIENWEPVQPYSNSQTLWTIACAPNPEVLFRQP